MRKVYLIILAFIILGIYSCKKDQDHGNKLSYKEIANKSNISNIPKEVLFYSDSVFYKNMHGTLKSATLLSITLSDMAELVEPIEQKYPCFDSLTLEDVNIIEQDFPTLSLSDIETNIEGISQVYEALFVLLPHPK